ncbi:hypothetical protein [Burkholderia sp. Ax-1724]|uniref:hypothetical protein n=1 Tax=Burkholderia sp. Ax-1724 TaxID=2608336 RepID=UPI001F03A4C9|nr:hypothetical protein [Burkholderia sp. Ax-1724]
MKMRSARELVVLGLLVLTVAGCGDGNGLASSSTSSTTPPPTNPTTPTTPAWTPGRYAADANLPDSPALPSDTQVCSVLEASNKLVKNADGSLPVSADPTPATYGGATTALNNPDQARIQAALDACGATVDAEVGAKIVQADQQAAATQQAANNPLVNIAGASSETLSNPSYKATKFAVRLVRNSGGAGNAFLSGPLVLPSGVTLWIDDGVTLFASRDVVVYDKSAQDRPNAITCGAAINNPSGLPAPAGTVNAGQATLAGVSGMQNCYPLIRGTHTVNTSIMGNGSIDARGYMPLISSSSQYPTIRWATGVTEAFTYSGNNSTRVAICRSSARRRSIRRSAGQPASPRRSRIRATTSAASRRRSSAARTRSRLTVRARSRPKAPLATS